MDQGLPWSSQLAQTFSEHDPSTPATIIGHGLGTSTPYDGFQLEPEHSGQAAFSQGPLELRTDEDGPVGDNFVRKLYLLLEDESLTNIVCWGSQENIFVIKDVNAFSADILGRVFKYSNFASFVRQLNKYDFHKMKPSDDSGLDDHSWIFRHRDFRRGNLEALDTIRRKVPGTKTHSRTANSERAASSGRLTNLHAQIDRMSVQQDELASYLGDMDDGYVTVLDGLVNLQRSYEQRDNAMRQIMEYTMQMNNDNDNDNIAMQ